MKENSNNTNFLFWIEALVFIAFVFGIKIIELLFLFPLDHKISHIGISIFENMVSVGFQLMLVFAIFFLFRLFSHKLAVIVSSILLCVLSYFELCLCIYSSQTGIFMGNEIFVRPFWEMKDTVFSFVSWKEIVATVIYFALYMFLSLWIFRKSIPIGRILSSIFLLFLILFSFLFFYVKPSHSIKYSNKVWEFIYSCVMPKKISFKDMNTKKYSLKEIEDQMVEYRKIYPDRATDNRYLLERDNAIKNVLAPYFTESDAVPNIVVLVVESLGADLFGINKDGLCFTPFLDSLSKHSLLWTNCLATTPRSFGAVPAITGSVPHGLKGFQFGNIPSHNSLLSVLKVNGFQTGAFYAGNFSFDRIYDYLIAQNIDYMSPFCEEYRSVKAEERDGTYWGFNDDVLFQKSLAVVSKRDTIKPFVDLYVTITQHEDLNLLDKQLEKEYYRRAEQIVNAGSVATKNLLRSRIGKLAATLYTDESIKHLIQGYMSLNIGENTIFVITGDHSMNIDVENPLDSYHVPLIIWSPLLQRTQHFKSVVSHLDITPSLISLLENSYGMNKLKTVHWVSDGLDTSVGFNSQLHNYFLRYSREVADGVFGKKYFSVIDGEPKLYEICDSLNVRLIRDTAVTNSIIKQFRAITCIENYVYENDYVTSNPVYSPKKHTVYVTTEIDSISCISPSQRPSVVGRNFATIYETSINTTRKEIKVLLQSDMLYTGSVWQDQFATLVLNCHGENISIFNEDYISKYIQNESYEPNVWYPMKFTKTIRLDSPDSLDLILYLSTTHKDDVWNPEHGVYLKNIQLTILESDN